MTEITLRKNLGKVYIFDTTPLSKTIWERLRFCGVTIDGFIEFRGKHLENDYVTLKQALGERAFILFPTPVYEDGLFDFFHNAGYQYEKDYLIYSHHMK